MSTIPALLLERLDRSPDAPILWVRAADDPTGAGRPDPDHPGWSVHTLAESIGHVSGLARRLASLGVGPGVRVAIIADTSHLWIALDLAIVSLGGVTVGLYPTLSPEKLSWHLDHAAVHLAVVADDAAFAGLEPHLDGLDALVHVRSMQQDGRCVPLTPAEPDLPFLRAQAARVQPDDVATIVYTSGTTGTPKGAVLTHRNFTAVLAASRDAIPTQPGDRSVVFLPLAHSLQRFTVYRGLTEDVGGFVCTPETLREALGEARPDLLVAVPRVLEKVKAAAEATAAARSPIAARIFDWAIRVGAARAHLSRTGRRVPPRLAAQHRLADRLVLRKIRAKLGGKLRFVVSGGAALSGEVAAWFEAVGVRVYEGWGLTETCAPATANTPDHQRLGTVGLPLPGVSLRLARDGEVLVKGPGLFQGYLDDPVATAAVLDADGWFSTGDLGSLDPDGFLRIIGRKKELIVTAGGQNVAPVPIEKAIEGGLVEQAVVVGSERRKLVALLSLDPEALAARARDAGWAGGPADWAQQPAVTAAVTARVEAANRGSQSYEQVRAHAILPAPLSVESGTLTPTLKLKRAAIEARYADLLDQLYA